MPIGDIAGELLDGVLRVIGRILVEVALEIAVRGPGYLIGRRLKKDIDPDGGWVVIAGLAFWLVIGVAGYFAYAYFSEALTMDKCLDAGGAFNSQTKGCIRS